MTQRCLYCKQEYEPDPMSKYQTDFEGCSECEKQSEDAAAWWAHEIVSVPLEIRKTL